MGSLIPRPCGLSMRLGCGEPRTQAMWSGYEARVWVDNRKTLQFTYTPYKGRCGGFLVTQSVTLERKVFTAKM